MMLKKLTTSRGLLTSTCICQGLYLLSYLNYCLYIKNVLIAICFSVSSSDKTDSAKKPRPDQTSGFLSHTASALCCRCRCCHCIVASLRSAACHKLEPHLVSQPATPPGAASSGSWTHLFNTHIDAVFSILTPPMSQSLQNNG